MPTDHRAPHRAPARVVGAGFAVLALSALAACGSGSTGSTGGAAGNPATSPAAGSGTASALPTAPLLATAGALRIAAGYVPAPASPEVAAAYFTVTNTGAADTLVAASSNASTTTTMHRTDGGSMVPLTSLPVPADASVAFSPGADHLMLEPLTRTLAKGDTVTLTLTFATAGKVTVTLPVTGYPTGGGLPSEALSPLPSTTAAP